MHFAGDMNSLNRHSARHQRLVNSMNAADSRIHIVKLKNYLERFGNEVPAVFDQTTLFQKDQSNGFSRDRLFSPYDSKVLHSLCFDVDLIGRNAEDLCQSRL